MTNNRRRLLAEVLSIDAWHKPFRTDGQSSAVHVEVSFQQGRFGGDDTDMPFTFRVDIKRALLTVKIESPLSIDRSSVGRSIPKNPTELAALLDAREAAMLSSKGDGKVTPLAMATALGQSYEPSDIEASKARLRVIQQYPRILVSAKPRGPQEYAWELIPAYEDFLDGQPWDAVDDPRFYVHHPDVNKTIEPSIKVTISCALDDIFISELMPKNTAMLSRLRSSVRNDVSEAAAIQYLKLILKDSDLYVSQLDNRFSSLIIAEAFSFVSKS